MKSGIGLDPHTHAMFELRRGVTAQLGVRERVCRMILVLTCCASPFPPSQTCARVRFAFLSCDTQRLRPRDPTDVTRDPQNNPTRAPCAGSGIDYLARTHVRASPLPHGQGTFLVLNRGAHERGDCDFLIERPDVSKNKHVFFLFFRPKS